MNDYDEETKIFLQELDALIERFKSGTVSQLDCKRIAYIVKLQKYLEEGREDKLEELRLEMEKEFGCP